MSYNDVLKMLETALNDADQLEDHYDVCKSTMANLDSNRAKAKKSGLSFSDDSYNAAKEKFASGDYVGANEIAGDCSQKLESCNSGFDTLSNLFEMLDTFEMKHTDDFDTLKDNLSELMAAGEFDKGIALCGQEESAIRSQLSDYEKAKALVSEYNEKIMDAKEHILIEEFVPDEESAEQHLEKRNSKEAIKISEKGIDQIQNALDNWRPEIKVTLPDDLVASESNRAVVVVENTGKAKAQSVTLVVDGIQVAGGELSTGEILPNNSEEIIAGLIPLYTRQYSCQSHKECN